MDWNWFFSSVSQSAAAIVGIFGGFIITKILSNEVTFSEKRNRLKELIITAEKIRDRSSDLYFVWYNEMTMKQEIKKIDKLLDDGTEQDPWKIYDELNFSIFMKKSFVTSEINNLLEIRRQKIQEQEENLPSFSGMRVKQIEIPRMTEPPNYVLIDNLQKERETIDSVIREARHHIRIISNFFDSTRSNPESSITVRNSLILLSVLFLLGVIVPLSYLPLPTSNVKFYFSISDFFSSLISIKGIILISVSLIFSVIIAMFFVINEKMKYPRDEMEKLRNFTSLGTYSNYFTIMEENLSNN